MATPKRTIMENRLSLLSSGPQKRDIFSDVTKTIPSATTPIEYGGVIGDLIHRLRDEQGETFQSIADELSVRLDCRIPIATMYNWAKGRPPRKGVEQVARQLRNMLTDGETIVGGAWCEPDETAERITALNMTVSVPDMARLTGTPKTTIFAWLAARHRVPRKRINAFEETVLSGADSLTSH